jgi:Tc toxin complex TcA C-terminal TcB-binding domain
LVPPTTAIATSTAIHNGDVSEIGFHDERWVPFEGAGAESRWQLELREDFRQFEYETITDAILGIICTADEHGGLRDVVERPAAVARRSASPYPASAAITGRFMPRQGCRQHVPGELRRHGRPGHPGPPDPAGSCPSRRPW